MRYLTIPLVTACFLLSSPAFALMCTKTYAQVTPGMTAAQVRAACGDPKSVQKKRGIVFKDERVEYWMYQGDDPSKRTSRAMRELGYSAEPTQTKHFTFDEDGKLVSMSVGQGTLSVAPVCGGTIRLGDPSSTVMSYCGQPTNRTHGMKRVEKGSVESEYWTYQFDQFRPPVRLMFQKGVLVNIAE